MEAQHRALSLGDDLLVVRVDDEREHRAVDAERRLDHVRDEPLARARVDPLEFRARGRGVLCEVEITPVRDSLELRPADREEVLDVTGGARVVGELVGVMGPHAEVLLAEAVARVPGEPFCDPVAVPLVRLGGRHEELHLHLLELERAEDEVPRRDLVAEGLADLRDPERGLAARELGDVLEVDEDALRGLRSQVDVDARLLDRADPRPEHEVELARLGEVAVGGLTGALARPLAAAHARGRDLRGGRPGISACTSGSRRAGR